MRISKYNNYIISNIYKKSGVFEMISIESFPNLQTFKFVIDVGNVVYHIRNKKGKPMLSNYFKLYRYLLNELYIESSNIIAISDPSIRYCIDEKSRFKELLIKREIIQAPKKADFYILALALRNKFVLIISNDRFKEFVQELPSIKWLTLKLVKFLIIYEDVLLSPDITYQEVLFMTNLSNILKSRSYRKLPIVALDVN
ncbi:hypothetical protein LCGC14_0887400 [marine sediment metagenome]|uniref:RNase NYN domain-containing protein n=1 Tax=marine sediment metagenome TaxID=412755 RepID=A0A0F9P060_9ZZZZ